MAREPFRPPYTPPEVLATPIGTAEGALESYSGFTRPDQAPAAVGAEAYTRTVSSPREVRPPNGLDWNRGGALTGLTAAMGATEIPGTALAVGNGRWGWIRSVMFSVQQLLSTSDIHWSIRLNGSSVQGWDDVFVLPGLITVERDAYGPEETWIEVPTGKTVAIFCEVRDAGVYDVSALHHGWAIPVEMATRERESWGL